MSLPDGAIPRSPRTARTKHGPSLMRSDAADSSRKRSSAVTCRAPEAALKSSKKLSGCTFRRSEEHTSELQSLMRISYAVFCLQTKKILHTKQLKSKRTLSH